MGDTLQYRRVIGLQYSLGKGEIKINMDGTNDDYYSNVDEIQIDPSLDVPSFEELKAFFDNKNTAYTTINETMERVTLAGRYDLILRTMHHIRDNYPISEL